MMRRARTERDGRVLGRNVVGFEQQLGAARMQAAKHEASGGIGRYAHVPAADAHVSQRLARRSIQHASSEDHESKGHACATKVNGHAPPLPPESSDFSPRPAARAPRFPDIYVR